MADNFKSDKHQIRQAFGDASHHYDNFAHLQRKVAKILMQKSGLTEVQGRVLDVGCGTGFLTRLAQTLSGDAWIGAVDIALPMLQVAKQRLPAGINYLCADAEGLPLKAASIDSVFSNLALQWCRNIPQVLVEFRRILKLDGRILFSTFGPQTLIELKQAWATVDNYRHVNDFYSVEQLQMFLKQGGWKNCRIDHQLYYLEYPSARALMEELKGLGAYHVATGRSRHLTGKSKFQRLLNSYPKGIDTNSVVASFEVIWVIAEAG